MKPEDFMKKEPEQAPGGVETGNVVDFSAKRQEKAQQDMNDTYSFETWVNQMKDQGPDAFLNSLPRDGDKVIVPGRFLMDCLHQLAIDTLMFSLINSVPENEVEPVIVRIENAVDIMDSAEKDISAFVVELVAGYKAFGVMAEKYVQPS